MSQSYIKAETQPIIDDIKSLEADGIKGAIVLRGDDLKTKWLAITSEQAKQIQKILLDGCN